MSAATPREASSDELVLASTVSPVGDLRLVASERGLRAVVFAREDLRSTSGVGPARADVAEGSSAILDAVVRQLAEYFEGRRRVFDIPLDPVGSAFQLSAWKVLMGIPFGTTISYADQARTLGDVRKARAVGGANGRNPIPIIVPCHRVIGSDGSLTGFSAGTEIKRFLLEFEQRPNG